MTLAHLPATPHNRANEWTNLAPEERRRRAVRAAADQDVDLLWSLCEAYLAQRSSAGVLISAHTLKSYRSGLRRFLAHVGESAWNVLRPGREEAQRWVGAQLAGGAKIATVRARVAAAALLYRALSWASACEAAPFADVIVPRDPEHPLDKNPPYADEVLREVYRRARSELESAKGARRAKLVRALALLTLLSHSGLRVGEALALRTPDLRFDGDEPAVAVRSGKGRKSRLVPASDRLVRALRAYQVLPRTRRHREDFVFPYRTWAGAARDLRPLFAREDGGSDWRGFHAFRKAMGSRLYEQLEDFVAVAEILGHEKVDTTRAYVRVGQKRARRAMRDW